MPTYNNILRLELVWLALQPLRRQALVVDKGAVRRLEIFDVYLGVRQV